MAFLAQRGLPDHLTLRILEEAWPDSVRKVCATVSKSLELVHRLQCDFPETWHREYDPSRHPASRRGRGSKAYG